MQNSEAGSHKTEEGKRGSGLNIYDISQAAGVSIATVSRVLNNSNKVSEKTRAKVLATMKRLGYTPNAFARGLGLGSMDTIGIMVTDASDTHLAAGVYYAEQALKAHRYATILACTGYELKDKKSAMELLLSKQIDGVLLIGSSFIEDKEEDRLYLRESAERVPIIIANGYMPGEHIYCVMNNEFESVFEVTQALLKKGRKKPIFLHCARTYSGMQKLNGFRAAMGAEGYRAEEERQIFVPKDLEAIGSILRQRAQDGLHFDAVICSEDLCAVAAMKFAAEMGISVPDEMDIVGYNNSILSRCTTPELTTVDNHVKEIAEKAVDQMIRVLRHEPAEQRAVIPCDLIMRGSAIL